MMRLLNLLCVSFFVPRSQYDENIRGLDKSGPSSGRRRMFALVMDAHSLYTKMHTHTLAQVNPHK